MVTGRWLMILLASGVVAAELVMPSYQLAPGKKLCYTVTSESHFGQGSRRKTRQWEFYVVGRIDSVAGFPVWQLIGRAEDKGYQTKPDGTRTELPGKVSWALFELDREVRKLQEAGDADPQSLFPPLPPDTVRAKRGWLIVTDTSRKEASFVKLENKNLRDSIWLFRMENSSPLDSVYGIRSTAEVLFNTRQGLVVRRESQARSDAGLGESRQTSVAVLDSVSRFEPDRLRTLVADLGRFFAAKREYDSITDAALERHDTLPVVWSEAESVLVRAMARVNDSVVVGLLREEQARHQQTVPTLLAQTRSRLELIGQPAPAWTLPDLDGRVRRLKDFRGRVLLLDFWYRACPWCIRAMPVLDSLAREYPARAVTVIGMNTDKDVADARFVVEKLRLSYLNLLSGEVYKKYGVTGFPTVVVVDRKGRISDIHTGYTPNLRARLERSIRRAVGED